jgi:hypothetical protein
MSYSDEPALRSDRIAGFVLWIVAMLCLFGLMLELIVEPCFWEEGCASSQAPRFICAFILTPTIAAPIGWAGYWVVNRIFHRATR